MGFICHGPLRHRFWVNNSSISIASRLSTRWLLRAILETREFASGNLLDVGCGQKPYAHVFSTSNHIGVDRLGSLHGTENVDVFADPSVLPFKDEIFDTVLCTEVLEHLPEPHRAVGEIARVLKTSGHLILSVPLVHWIHEAPHDFYRFTMFGLRHLLESYGFHIVKILNRGGALTVLVDIYARASSMYLCRILKVLHVPERLINLVLLIAIALPQHVTAFVVFFVHDHLPRIARFFDTSERLTLGYVVVARKQ